MENILLCRFVVTIKKVTTRFNLPELSTCVCALHMRCTAFAFASEKGSKTVKSASNASFTTFLYKIKLCRLLVSWTLVLLVPQLLDPRTLGSRLFLILGSGFHTLSSNLEHFSLALGLGLVYLFYLLFWSDSSHLIGL